MFLDRTVTGLVSLHAQHHLGRSAALEALLDPHGKPVCRATPYEIGAQRLDTNDRNQISSRHTTLEGALHALDDKRVFHQIDRIVEEIQIRFPKFRFGSIGRGAGALDGAAG